MTQHLKLAITLSLTTLIVAGCSSSSTTHPQEAVYPKLAAPQLPLQPLTAGQSAIVDGPLGTKLAIHALGESSETKVMGEGPLGSKASTVDLSKAAPASKLFLEVEATFSPEEYSEIRKSGTSLTSELDRISQELRQIGALTFDRNDEAGYISLWLPYSSDSLLGTLKNAHFSRQLYFSPVDRSTEAMKRVHAVQPAELGLIQAQGTSYRTSHAGFSGLEQINAIEFVKIAETSIGGGVKVDGSSVKLGIADTGITYNHQTFLGKDGKPRITYLKDFTREGRVYFSDKAVFEAKAVDGKPELLTLHAEVIVTPKLPNLPTADKFTELKDIPIKVTPALKEILLDPKLASHVHLGFLDESLFQSAKKDEIVDINGNGKTDDIIPVLYFSIAGLDPKMAALLGTDGQDKVMVDFEATGDFTKAATLRNFNNTHDVAKVFAEKIGFDLSESKLPLSKGDDIATVKSASIVGFDPGNHGSHVGGIAAGRKTFANDPDDTLARGVAPNAEILLDRTCSNSAGCSETASMLDLAMNAGVEVINLSLGGLSPLNDGYGVAETIANRMTELKNVLFVISAGNEGPGRQTLGSPSVARLSMSVGAAASRGMIQRQYQWPGRGADHADSAPSQANDDFMLFFSSRGPTASGGFKPNLVAPGTELSSVQLTSAPGVRSGLDVYWGTSMSAPTTTGAYALFLDAIKKHNLKNPKNPLPTDVLTLRNVLIDSARPFDVDKIDPVTGKHQDGQYTWIDQGKGMLDLVSAWNKLIALRDAAISSGVKDADGKDIDLDYSVITSYKTPNGLAYDGSRSVDEDGTGKNETPAFGAGLMLDYFGKDTFRKVYIERRLPAKYAAQPNGADLESTLRQTYEDFVLKTTVYGSDKNWIQAGVLEQRDCAGSESAPLTLIGRGAETGSVGTPDGKPAVNEIRASTVNLCINRALVSSLAPGEHGALIEGFRKVGDRVSPVSSFTIPISMTVPHRVLAGSTSYVIQRTVTSFGVDRNYVVIPQAATAVKLTLEVPTFEKAGSCSGVELMALEGGNTLKPKEERPALRVSNCDAIGAPVNDLKKTRLELVRTNPVAGMWDINVFGQYQFVKSPYTLRVDYLIAESSTKKIDTTLAGLSGKFTWTVKEASFAIAPDSKKSSFELLSLVDIVKPKIKKDETITVESKLGKLRSYPAEAKFVRLSTGGSPGNDIDIAVYSCPKDLKDFDEAKCKKVGDSTGPTDVESVRFEPKADQVYALRVSGFDIKDAGEFTAMEEIEFEKELGALDVSGAGPEYSITYSFTAAQIAASKLAQHPLFTSGTCTIGGSIYLRSAEGTVLDIIPVSVTAAAAAASTPAPAPAPAK